MYGDVDDDGVFDAYMPGGATKLPALHKISKPEEVQLVDRQRVRKTATNKSDVSEVSASPKVFSPAGYSPAIQSQSRSYATRTRSKDVFFRFNCKESTSWESSRQNAWNININPFRNDIFKSGFKYMFQRTTDASRTLNDNINDLAPGIIQYFQLDEDQDLRESASEDVNYVGRIRCDGKLSANSTYFEGTRDKSNGQVVALDLSQLEEYFLFPGQVLALSGKNNLGNCVLVSKMFFPRPLPFSDKPIQIDSTTGPLRMLVAAGPYTTSDSLLYEPLSDFVEEIRKHRPQVCIMIGPFIDASHPLIEDVSETFDDIFNNQMTYLSDEVAKIDANCKIILVSTSKDAQHHPVFPTPPYILKGFNNLLAVPDPAMISVGGVVIGITSTDILKHMGGNELGFSTIASERMGRIARHLLCQRSFYPLYPPDESVPVDIVHLSENASIECTPHILILPSDLRHFIKDVDGTVVVNPERLTKGLSGGTFAKLQIDLPDQDECRGPIADFLMGEIIKI